MKLSLLVPAAALALVAAAAGTASADVTTTITGTTVPGTLTITGASVAASLSGAPGSYTSAAGVTALAVADLTGSDKGWKVVATYSPVPAGTLAGTALVKDVGGENIAVTTGNVVGGALGSVLASDIETKTEQVLTTPVTVANTAGTKAGTGITTLDASYKVRLPVTAKVGDVYGGVVTYTAIAAR